jgi:hypothetical protein
MDVASAADLRKFYFAKERRSFHSAWVISGLKPPLEFVHIYVGSNADCRR